jgi:hypothetical protein
MTERDEKPKRPNRMTAAELIRRLEADPEWVAKRDAREAEREARAAALALAERPLVSDLRAAGFVVSSVWDLVNSSAHYDAALPVLASHLRRPYPDAIIDGIARALAVPAAEPLVWDAMASLFQEVPLKSRAKQGAAVALANMTSERTIQEVVQFARDDRHGTVRVLLVSALARFSGPDVENALRHLLKDPETGKGVRLELRRRRHPLGRFRPA